MSQRFTHHMSPTGRALSYCVPLRRMSDIRWEDPTFYRVQVIRHVWGTAKPSSGYRGQPLMQFGQTEREWKEGKGGNTRGGEEGRGGVSGETTVHNLKPFHNSIGSGHQHCRGGGGGGYLPILQLTLQTRGWTTRWRSLCRKQITAVNSNVHWSLRSLLTNNWPCWWAGELRKSN